MNSDRRLQAYKFRTDAAAMARDRAHPAHHANGDEQRYAAARYAMNFSKGLQHDMATGLLQDPAHFLAFRKAIDEGYIDAFTANVPMSGESGRAWEAPTAGVVGDLQGPDAQAVTMPPAPALCSDELAFEMAEVYELALLRDVPFHAFRAGGASAALTAATGRLNALAYAGAGFPGRPRMTDGAGQLDRQTVFRGSGHGVDQGPYLSQFLAIGNTDRGDPAVDVGDGLISYGAQQISQKVNVAREKDWMITWHDWLEVQNGKSVHDGASLLTDDRRFIYTPRDLATFVHYDALYQAYLNACLILLDMWVPMDPSFGGLSGQQPLQVPGGALRRHNTGFALYGGPQILTLVTEVATRALKAVRFQKFNTHLRLRPEALAARIEKAADIDTAYPATRGAFTKLAADLDPVVQAIRAHNLAQPEGGEDRALLPMAFQEGSPMHPSYGAGHATVAGACVTMLKAFFDTGTVLVEYVEDGQTITTFRHPQPGDTFVQYVAKNGGNTLDREVIDCPLTLEGELNKLAANISIGRNMAGVHYFSDYYDSLRMGEEIALAMLEEQAICYAADPFVLTVPTFDGGVRRIGAL